MPHVGVAVAVGMVIAVAMALLGREPGAAGHRQLRHLHHPGAVLQRWCEAVAIDQHQARLAQLAALLRGQLQLVGVVVGAQQAAHRQVVGGQPAGDVAEGPVGGHHIHRRTIPRPLAGHRQQGEPPQQQHAAQA
jgi:hypothetical protein